MKYNLIKQNLIFNFNKPPKYLLMSSILSLTFSNLFIFNTASAQEVTVQNDFQNRTIQTQNDAILSSLKAMDKKNQTQFSNIQNYINYSNTALSNLNTKLNETNVSIANIEKRVTKNETDVLALKQIQQASFHSPGFTNMVTAGTFNAVPLTFDYDFGNIVKQTTPAIFLINKTGTYSILITIQCAIARAANHAAVHFISPNSPNNIYWDVPLIGGAKLFYSSNNRFAANTQIYVSTGSDINNNCAVTTSTITRLDRD